MIRHFKNRTSPVLSPTDITQINLTVFDDTIDSEMPDLEGPSESENNDFTFLKL